MEGSGEQKPAIEEGGLGSFSKSDTGGHPTQGITIPIVLRKKRKRMTVWK